MNGNILEKGKKKSGITLTILVITIVIMAILAGITFFAGYNWLTETDARKTMSEMTLLKTRLQDEKERNGYETTWWNYLGRDWKITPEEYEKLTGVSTKKTYGVVYSNGNFEVTTDKPILIDGKQYTSTQGLREYR